MDELFKSIKDKNNIKKVNNSLIGNICDEVIDGPLRGWICGHFYPKNSPLHRNDIEVCFKKLHKGKKEKEHFHLCSFEFLLVLKGKVKFNISGENHILTPGQFYILEPKEREYIVEVIDEAFVLAVRTPSLAGNKVFVDNK